MLTTQIGSLPFLDISSAIDYAIQFDLPFIPSLPQLDKSEMMMALAMDGYLKMDISIKEKCLIPMLEKYRPERCKYQVLGPVSAMYIHNMKLDEQMLLEYLLQKISEVEKKFQQYNSQLVLFLDEPCLEFVGTKDYLILQKTVEALRDELKIYDVGIHCCSNANWQRVNDLPISMLSFDYYRYHQSLNQHLMEFEDKTLCFGVLPTTFDHSSNYNLNLQTKQIKNNIKMVTDYSFQNVERSFYVTPCCGLGMSSIEHANVALKIAEFFS